VAVRITEMGKKLGRFVSIALWTIAGMLGADPPIPTMPESEPEPTTENDD
jgi:hypothetical protein